MLENFICYDGETCPIDECLKKCRLGQRCAPKTYLRMVANEREWTGKPSVTQLLKGTMEAYLMLTKPYSVDPDSAAFRVVGSRGHALLEQFGDAFDMVEKKLGIEGISGTTDLLEPTDEDDSVYDIVDTKVVGSFVVAGMLGIAKKDKALVNVPPDYKDYDKQLAIYEIAANMAGIETRKRMIHAIARDGNTWIAKSRGVMRNTYYLEVPKINKDEVLNYFIEKRDKLLFAMDNQQMPEEVCTKEEAWNGNKCAGYCAVREYCPRPWK